MIHHHARRRSLSPIRLRTRLGRVRLVLLDFCLHLLRASAPDGCRLVCRAEKSGRIVIHTRLSSTPE